MEDEKKDTRPLDQLNFGYEFPPSLAKVMEAHPWPETDFHCDLPDNPPPDFDPEKFLAGKLAAWKGSMSALPTDEAKAAWTEIHAAEIARTRDILIGCGVKIADDINQLGCTGVIAHAGYTLEDVTFLRMALAGSGVGLPCFVPPSRYCLGHDSIGGLAVGQKPYFTEEILRISRDLTPAEQARVELVEQTRQQLSDGANFTDRMLKARNTLVTGERDIAMQPDATLPVDATAAVRLPPPRAQVEPGPEASARHPQGLEPYMPTESFICLLHPEKQWTCRFCVAEQLVAEDLVPVFRLAGPMGVSEIAADTIDDKIAELNKIGSVDHIEIFAQVARYKRKLARD